MRRTTDAVKWLAILVVAVAVGAGGLVGSAPLQAQDKGGNGPAVDATGAAVLVPQVRSMADVRAPDTEQRAMAPQAPAGPVAKPFRPTVNAVDYAAEKAAAAAWRGKAAAQPLVGAAATMAPTLQFINFTGLSAGDIGPVFAPSDSHGAVGHTQFVEVVNAAIGVYSKGSTTLQPTLLGMAALTTFFGTSETLFDPRVIYDPTWQRWIVVATRLASSPFDTSKRFRLAVSRTNNAMGSWCTYPVELSGGSLQNGDFVDYPQLGMDLDALIVTANVFTSSNAFRTATVLPLPKALVYNCLRFSVPRFESGLVPTLAPPIVRDANASAFIVSAGLDGVIRKWTLTNGSRNPGVALEGPVAIAGVPAYGVPPDAAQPGTTTRLDTMDGRFVNASTQVGTQLWNVHSINNGGIAAVRWYRIDTTSNAIAQQGTIPGGSTHMFNASIAVNDAQNAFVTYSASSESVRAQIRFTGKLSGDASMPAGTTVVTSAASFSGLPVARWGDYSAVSIDPSDTTKAWFVNQRTRSSASQFTWGTRIGRMGQ